MSGLRQSTPSMATNIMSSSLTTSPTTFGYTHSAENLMFLKPSLASKSLLKTNSTQNSKHFIDYSDNNGEYIAMTKFLAENGITHLIHHIIMVSLNAAIVTLLKQVWPSSLTFPYPYPIGALPSPPQLILLTVCPPPLWHTPLLLNAYSAKH